MVECQPEWRSASESQGMPSAELKEEGKKMEREIEMRSVGENLCRPFKDRLPHNTKAQDDNLISDKQSKRGENALN